MNNTVLTLLVLLFLSGAFGLAQDCNQNNRIRTLERHITLLEQHIIQDEYRQAPVEPDIHAGFVMPY